MSIASTSSPVPRTKNLSKIIGTERRPRTYDCNVDASGQSYFNRVTNGFKRYMEILSGHND